MPPKSSAPKDRAESDLIQAIQKETDAQRKLALLKQWEQQYPASNFAPQRTVAEAQTDQQVMMAGYGKADPALRDAALTAAHDILDHLNRYFDASLKPPGLTEADWRKARQTFETEADTVTGWVSMMRNDGAAAEPAFRRVLQLDPDNAQAAWFLGLVITAKAKIAFRRLSMNSRVLSPSRVPKRFRLRSGSPTAIFSAGHISVFTAMLPAWRI